MNKLMLAAAVALAMGGYAMAECGIPQGCGPLVYDLNMNLKTTLSKPLKTVICGLSDCFRVKTTRKLNGFIYAGDCECWCDDDALNDSWAVTLWEKKSKILYAFDDDFTWTAFWRIGKAKNELEVEWEFESPGFVKLTGQGFGKADGKIAKNASGSVTGWTGAPLWYKLGKKADDCVYCPAYPYDFCTKEVVDGAGTISFGTWKMKYNAKASNVLAKTGDLPAPKKFDDYLTIDEIVEFFEENAPQ